MATENFAKHDGNATVVDYDESSRSDTDSHASASPRVSSVRDGDRFILENDAEQEKLLTKPTRLEAVRNAVFARDNKSKPKSLRDQRMKEGQRAARKRRQSQNEQDSEVMFEMEGGFKDNSSEDFFEVDRTDWSNKKGLTKRDFCRRIALLHIIILLLFVALVLGAYNASSRQTWEAADASTSNNGTHIFRPTTILISLDGFRADFLTRDLTPALSAFIASGTSPRYMLPSFPSVTFPNHFTLVTGLFPESHGVVGNSFFDPALQEEFYYTHTEVSMQAKWWTAEPLWVTAEDQGVRTAVHMWPGSEAHIPDIEPTYVDKFNDSEKLVNKVDRIMSWLDLPGDDDSVETDNLRPQLIAAYVPNVDADGHKYGPNSTEIRGTIADVDSMLALLVEGLYARNLTEIVNIIVVSDHGMASTATSRLIQLDDLIDLSLVDHIDGWPLRGLRLQNPERDVPVLYEQLSSAAKELDSFEVYTLDTMPERWHFTNNDRIAPLWVIPKTDWAVVEKTDFDVARALATGEEYHPKGLHGYDHEHPLMRAIFVARGPAFPHAPNSRVQVFQNIEVYNIVCDSLGIRPHPNNGTLRLPLKTEGLHSDSEAGQLDTPSDPPASVTSVLGTVKTSSSPTATPGSAVETDSPDATNDPGHSAPPEDPAGWWKFVHDQIEKAKEWTKQLVDSIKANKNSDNAG